MTVGTLRDQVIYPHVAEDFRRRGSVDTDLEDILNKVWATAAAIVSAASYMSRLFLFSHWITNSC